jgi:uncharacterized RDD family membrane protein YckC
MSRRFPDDPAKGMALTQPEDPSNPNVPPPRYEPSPGYPVGPPQSYARAPAAPPGVPYGVAGLPIPPGAGLASRGRRCGAFFLAIPLTLVTLVIGYVIWGAILWGRGTSPALKVLKCKVIDANTGQVVGWGRMALRDIVGGIVQGILGFITELVSLVLFLTDERNRNIPDRIATTLVVYDPNGILG